MKTPGLGILQLSLVFSTYPCSFRPEAAASVRAPAHHVEVVEGDGSCDQPAERAIVTGHLFDPRNVLVAGRGDDDDVDNPADEAGSSPGAIVHGLLPWHDPAPPRGLLPLDVVIQGKKRLLAIFSRAGPTPAPSAPRQAACPSDGARRFLLRSAAPDVSNPGNRHEICGPASRVARRSTRRDGALASLDATPVRAGEADRLFPASTAEASPPAPAPR